ncbi:MAG: nucleotidyltransferase substrate binding protein [Proteobacteria bacterium]|nr:nucleotidyltransferase substrate binding protein [Pseudomonadota bacterium]
MLEYELLKRSLLVLQRHNRLRISLDKNVDPISREVADVAVAHGFQIGYECLLQALKKYMRVQEKIHVIGSAREIFRLAAQRRMLPSPVENWFDYIEIRKNAVHDHSRIKLKDTLKKIDRFIADAIHTHQKITGQKWQG